MNLQSHVATMHPIAKAHGYVLLVFGLAFDVVVNIVPATVIFADMPREFLLTTRLKRYHGEAYKGTWRARLADWVCSHLLDQFDVNGDHC
jgi:hypothetical protein